MKMRIIRNARRVEMFFSTSWQPDLMRSFSGSFDVPDVKSFPGLMRRTFFDSKYTDTRYSRRCVDIDGNVHSATFFNLPLKDLASEDTVVDRYLRSRFEKSSLPENPILTAWLLDPVPQDIRLLSCPSFNRVIWSDSEMWKEIENISEAAGVKIGCHCHYTRSYDQRESIAVPLDIDKKTLDNLRVMLNLL